MDVAPILAIMGGLVLLWALVLALLLVFRPTGVQLRELIRVVPDVVRLLRSLIGDRSTPLDVRLVLGFLVLWIVSPIDLIPEFIPLLGPLDDVVVAAVALRYTRRRLGIEELRRRWSGTDDSFALLVRMVGTS